MPKSSTPFIKSGPLISENLGISNDPNVPTCSEHHFKEKRLVKIIPSMNNHIRHRVPCRPFNLKVIPDTNTEIAVEEEMIPGFSNL